MALLAWQSPQWRKSVLVAAAACMLMLYAGLAAAATVEKSRQLITWLGDQAIDVLRDADATLEKREGTFHDLLRNGFALDYIGQFVLGRSWRKASKAQRADFLTLFDAFVVKTYARRLGEYSGETFIVKGARTVGKKGDVVVQTQINRPEKPALAVDWRVREIKSEHKIIDVVVEGISMAITQRQDFAAVTRKSGVEGLIKLLRTRVENGEP